MLEIVTDITEGWGRPEQLDLLRELADTVAQTALCGLGKTAPNPVLSTLRYFADEYAAHVVDKRCPAGVCQALISYQIAEEPCTRCGACLRACPHEAITGDKAAGFAIDAARCRKCGICAEECQFAAITVH
jgi:Pyruvate/2-oxoacid:ferredoxin oxidoreductase delta subunit